MSDAALRSAIDDLFAYARTLDAREALGELVHVAGLLEAAANDGIPPGGIDRAIAVFMGALARRLVEVNGVPYGPTEPDHATDLHSCNLLARCLVARMD